MHQVSHVRLKQTDGHRMRFRKFVRVPSHGKVMRVRRTVKPWDKIERPRSES